MPPLENPRHERFVQALFEGKPANKAYEEAGYKAHDGNCIRLRGNERVRARLAELQGQVAKKTAVTVESLLEELEQARVRADSLSQLSAAVRATAEKAKISGLLVQRVEVGGPGEFDKCQTEDQVIEITVQGFIEEGYLIGREARAGLVELMQRQVCEQREFLATLPRAGFNYLSRPVSDSREPERKRLGSNGQKPFRS
jgi:hypothetical protein